MFHFTGHFFSLGSDGVHLVDEYDARSSLLRFLEDLAQSSLGFAVELRHYLRSGDDVEVGVRLIGDSLGYQRFAAAWRAVKEDSFGGLDAQPLEELRVSEWEFHHFPYSLNLPAEPTNVLVRDYR